MLNFSVSGKNLKTPDRMVKWYRIDIHIHTCTSQSWGNLNKIGRLYQCQYPGLILQ